MQIKLNSAGPLHMQLHAGQVFSAPRLDGLTVEALRGSMWITFEAEGVDHVLKPGERLCLGNGGRVVLEALEPTELSVFAPPAGRRSPERLGELTRHIARRVSACLGDLPVCTRNWVHAQSAHRLSLETL